MIESHQDYLDYLEADRISLRAERTLRGLLFDDIWKFQRTMRLLEYLTNCRKSRLLRALVNHVYHRQGRALGFSIPINVFGPGLSIAHQGTIVVHGGASIGCNCRLHVCVNIGASAGQSAAPVIGDNCYIAPGVKIFGGIEIGPNMAIGANAVVNRSFAAGNATIAGVPAKVVSSKTSEGLLQGIPPRL